MFIKTNTRLSDDRRVLVFLGMEALQMLEGVIKMTIITAVVNSFPNSRILFSYKESFHAFQGHHQYFYGMLQ